MRWLHSLFHWRCEREIARLDALVGACLPRYQPVTTAPATMRSVDAGVNLAERQDENIPEGMTVTRWPERVRLWNLD